MNEDRWNLIEKTLEIIAADGVSDDSLLRACRSLEMEDSFCKFTDGIAGLLKEYERFLDAILYERSEEFEHLRVHERVKLAVKMRLLQYQRCANYRAVLKKQVAFFVDISNWPIFCEVVGATVSSIWLAIGDKSSDFNYYTKRLSLSGVYVSTLLYFIDDYSENFSDTMAFLDRRIDNILMVHRFKNKFMNIMHF